MVIVIRKSCITGAVVWVYYGPTRHAARSAYYRARRLELHLDAREAKCAERRRGMAMGILNECVANMDPTQVLTAQQREAAKVLRRLSEEPFATYRGFHDHVIEEERRRKEDQRIRQQMRERKQQEEPKNAN